MHKKIAALVAATMIVAPAVAQSDAAASLTPVRAGAPVAEASAMGTPGDGRYAGGFWVAIIGAALLAAFILVILDEEDEDFPSSP